MPAPPYNLGPVFQHNWLVMKPATHWLEHLAIAHAIAVVPRELDGVVVECGAYKGGATVNLSLACAFAHRDLLVFDSFCGLPEPAADDRVHVEESGERRAKTYAAGDYAGTLQEVRENVGTYGCRELCTFRPGWFADTLPGFHESIVVAFLDVDLTESLKTCLQYLWPLLHPGCLLFTHEARDPAIQAAFVDEAWWQDTLGVHAPGLVGGLGGLPLLEDGESSLAYTMKGAA